MGDSVWVQFPVPDMSVCN